MDLSWKGIERERGVVVAMGDGFESFLPWWYNNLRRESDLPVAFIDLGMKAEAVAWCKERGYYIDIQHHIPALSAKRPSEEHLKLWETIVSSSLPIRPYWFAKPIAMMQTPFQKTLFLDGDCEVRGSLEPLFDQSFHSSIAIAFDCPTWHDKLLKLGLRYPDEKTWNSGVIIYEHGAPLIERWATRALLENHLYLGDQDLLARTIYEERFKPFELDPIWNWNMRWGENRNALIYHHSGGAAKIALAHKLS